MNPSTTIGFTVPVRSSVTVGIYNIRGLKVTTLFEGIVEAGKHEAMWTAESASGVYYYRIDAVPEDKTGRKFSRTGWMILVR